MPEHNAKAPTQKHFFFFFSFFFFRKGSKEKQSLTNELEKPMTNGVGVHIIDYGQDSKSSFSHLSSLLGSQSSPSLSSFSTSAARGIGLATRATSGS